MAVRKAAVAKPDISKALAFASGGKVSELRAVGGKSGLVPEGDVRLTANIRGDLHLKLKMEAAKRRTTIGELIEALVERHL